MLFPYPFDLFFTGAFLIVFFCLVSLFNKIVFKMGCKVTKWIRMVSKISSYTSLCSLLHRRYDSKIYTDFICVHYSKEQIYI